MKVTNIRIREYAAVIEVVCPGCLHKNRYIVHQQGKFSADRPCYECGAILMFDCTEEVKNG